jgi:hypothetical protein
MKRSRDPEDEPTSSSYPTSGSERESQEPEAPTLPRSKIVGTDPLLVVATGDAGSAMACLLHSQKLTFSSYDEYEAHYNNAHVNRCLECKRNFPSARLLTVHIEDCHDPLVALKREKGEHTV